ncbi:MAG: CHASE2 domain-containing protein [Magnetococcales bacterium]|nr:CHASE2 domain-containing protein [Magnetococcales bacterium]
MVTIPEPVSPSSVPTRDDTAGPAAPARPSAWAARLPALLLLALLLALQGIDPQLLAGFRLKVFDTWQRLHPRAPDATRVLILDIDERALDRIGQWPWPRTRLAEVVERLQALGAAGVGFNFVLAGRDRFSPHALADSLDDLDANRRAGLRALADTDAVLADALRHRPVVLGQMVRYGSATVQTFQPSGRNSVAVTGGDARPLLPRVDGLIPNHAPLEESAAGSGLLFVNPEADGVVRRIPLLVRVGDGIHPGFPLEMLRVVTGGRGLVAVVDGKRGLSGVRVGGSLIPTDAQGRVWIHYEAVDPARYIPALDLLEGRVAPDLVRGRLVLVGSSAAGLQDILATPSQGEVTGVEIQSQVIETILQGSRLHRPPHALALELAATALFGLLFIGLVPWLGMRATLPVVVLVVAALAGAGFLAFQTLGLLLDPAFPAGSGMILFLFLSYQAFRGEELQRRLEEVKRQEWERVADILEQRVQKRTEQLVIAQNKLEKLVEMGIALSTEQDLDRLLERILHGGRDISQADMATLFLRTENDTLEFAHRTGTDSLPTKVLPLFDPATGRPNDHYVSVRAALTGETIRLDDVYGPEVAFDVTGAKEFDAATGYRTRTMLVVPLKTRHGQPLGALQLINALAPHTGAVIPFDPALVGFVESLASKGAVALDNLRLIQAQERLFESIIKVLAGAIDAKSPYTGGHCARVPELGRLLAQAACDSTSGPFADFAMRRDDWKAFHLAGWLHDCGKIITPEHVVDKATKLETVYNRIHEIRMRFEVLRRDADIAHLTALHAGGDPAALQAQRAERLRALEEDFAFVAECNLGGEFMDPGRLERLQRIGARTWQRHFSDRLGLSSDEQQRLLGIPEPPLPAAETLLADKPEHIVPRPNQETLYAGHPGLELRVQIPQHQYNFGELYNLGIGRGTLTEEERFKINEHIIHTILMLHQLPFPKNLRGVVDMAGSHHETMTGTGYPRRLKREQMSVQARILAIADIFEALTAADRPYKKPKTLSQSLKIMGFMRNDGHIDAELFDLFLQSGIHRRYAERFLAPEQIDAVEIADYLSRRV